MDQIPLQWPTYLKVHNANLVVKELSISNIKNTYESHCKPTPMLTAECLSILTIKEILHTLSSYKSQTMLLSWHLHMHKEPLVEYVLKQALLGLLSSLEGRVCEKESSGGQRQDKKRKCEADLRASQKVPRHADETIDLRSSWRLCQKKHNVNAILLSTKLPVILQFNQWSAQSVLMKQSWRSSQLCSTSMHIQYSQSQMASTPHTTSSP